MFVGVIHQDKLVYSKNIDEGKYQVEVYTSSDHQHVATLSALVSTMYISATSNPSGWCAIVDSGYNTHQYTLDIYTPTLQHHHRIHLTYEPRGYHGVLSMKDVILVARYHPAELVVYNWAGGQLGRLTPGDLGVDDGRMWGIGQGGEGQLQVATGEYDGDRKLYIVKTLHVYHVE